MCAAAGIMAFSEVLADVSNHGKYSLSLYDVGRFMRLDAAAQRALNVMKTKFDANDNFSLYGLMGRARTSMGKRLLKVGLGCLFSRLCMSLQINIASRPSFLLTCDQFPSMSTLAWTSICSRCLF